MMANELNTDLNEEEGPVATMETVFHALVHLQQIQRLR